MVIATPTFGDHTGRMDAVFACTKTAELQCELSKYENLKDPIKYLVRMVKNCVIRPKPYAVEAE